MYMRTLLLGAIGIAFGCGDDASGTGGGPTSDGSGSGSGTDAAPSGPLTEPGTDEGNTSMSTSTGASSSADSTGESSGSSGGMLRDCDFVSADSMVVIEAESLPVGEEWQTLTDEAGYYAGGYIGWTGPSFNGDPTHGVTSVAVYFDQPGRYRLQWRNRIGMGMNTTEHNDTWVKFPDAADYYGLQLQGSDERRVYPRPRCEDAAAMAAIEALPQVIAVDCVEGSSVDEWFKVYSSGANDWSWSTRTNDNNPYEVMVEIDAPGAYVFSIAARGDWHLIDRIVIHEESIDDAIVHDPVARETICPPI